MNLKIFCLCILLFTPFILADDVIVPPDPVKTTSLQKLVNSLSQLQKEVNSLRKENRELKIQLNNKLDQQYHNLMFFLAFFCVGSISLLYLLKRVYLLIMFRRLQHRTIAFHEQILGGLNLSLEESGRIYSQLLNIDASLVSLQSNLIKAIPKFKPISPKKKSIWGRLCFWKRGP